MLLLEQLTLAGDKLVAPANRSLSRLLHIAAWLCNLTLIVTNGEPLPVLLLLNVRVVVKVAV